MKKTLGEVVKKVVRADGWRNVATRLGIPGYDKSKAAIFWDDRQITDTELANLFHGSPVARKAVMKIQEEAFRLGFEVRIPEEQGGMETEQLLMRAARELDVERHFKTAATWERLFGGAAIWVVTDRQVDPALEMSPGERVIDLRPIDSRKLYPRDIDDDPVSPTFGQATHFAITEGSLTGDDGISVPVTAIDDEREVVRIHRSRLVLFPGALCTDERREENGGWGLSVLEIVYDELRRNAEAWQTAGYAMLDQGSAVLKLENLLRMLEVDGGKQAVEARAQAIDQTRSIARTVVIGPGEEYIQGQHNFGTLPQMLGELMHDLAQALDMPVTVLFGRSPAGMNSTGQSDLELWHNTVDAYRRTHVKPRLEQLLRFIVEGDERFPTELSADIEVTFPSLSQMSEMEKAQMRQIVGATDALYLQNEVLLPEEVAQSRFRQDGWSMDTDLDEESREAREQMLTAGLEQAIEDRENPPEPSLPGQTGAQPGNQGQA